MIRKIQTPVSLGDRRIGDGKSVFVICEAGLTNYGEMDLAKRQIDAAVAARADAVKFKVQKTENFVSKPVAKRLEKELGYDWYERLKYKDIPYEGVRELKVYSKEKGGPVFFATAHEEESLNFIADDLKLPFLKVGSGEAHNLDFLKKVGAKRRPVIISFGLQSDDEIVRAVAVLREAGAAGVVALHCTTLYPTPYTEVALRRMDRIHELTGGPVGLSDHSVGWHICLAAVARGAAVIEKHLTFDKTDPRSLDNPGALLPDEFTIMVRQIRDIEEAMRPLNERAREKKLAKARAWAGQAIVAARDIPAGTVLSRHDLAFKRPAKGGIPADKADEVIGRKTKVAIPADEQVLLNHLR